MRFHIIGTGAIGGVTGAFLRKDGEDVTFVDVVPEHVAAINARGLRVDGVRHVLAEAPAILSEELAGPIDVALLAVKSRHTQAALDLIGPHLTQESTVVSLQNGLNPYIIAARIGAERVIGGFVNFAADYIEPGLVRYGGAGEYYLGRIDGSTDTTLVGLVTRFSRIMDTTLTTNVMGYLWSKECYDSLLVGTALVDAPVHEVLAHPDARAALTAAVVEAVTIADACGVTLEPFDPFDPALFHAPLDHAAIDAFYDEVVARFRGRPKQHTGIWRDLAVRKRPTEVPWLTGELVRRAGERAIPAPINTRLVELIAEIERGEREMGWDNLDSMQSGQQ
ncbi:MAG: ketopantoate reductase family protein [Chloroflexota bacterium]|nr:ketopantoate reductase family protein [Chloroflexota bacterium]